MSLADKTAILASRGLGTETVTVDGVGDFLVRGMTRAEVMTMRGAGLDEAQLEVKMLALALVKPDGEPAFTEDDVAQWAQIAPAGEFEPLTDAVTRLSGLAQKQVKAEMQRFRS